MLIRPHCKSHSLIIRSIIDLIEDGIVCKNINLLEVPKYCQIKKNCYSSMNHCSFSTVSTYCVNLISFSQISKPCLLAVDCCDNMAEQCRNKRYTSLCKLPKCLRRVLRSRKCPKTSPSRKKILETLHTYLSFCKKSK